jgi:hypothetical protein
VAWGVWHGLDDALGRSLAGQLVSVTGGLLAGAVVYVGLVLALGIPEARRIAGLVARRLRRGRRA